MNKCFRKWLILCVSCAVLDGNVSAQITHTDSLETVLTQAGMADSLRLKNLLKPDWDLSFYNAQKARIYLKEGLTLAQKHNDLNAMGNSYAHIGSTFFNENKFDSALYYYAIAESYFIKDTNAQGVENVIINRLRMGTVALQQNFYGEALNHYFKVIALLEGKAGANANHLIAAYANSGLVYNQMKQYHKALNYHKKALDVLKQNPMDKKQYVQLQMRIAIDLLNLKAYDEFSKVVKNIEPVINKLNSNDLSTSFYALKGKYLNDIQDFNAAMAVSEKALAFAESGTSQLEEADILFQLGRSLFKLGDYTQSLEYLLRSISICTSLNDKMREKKTLNYIARAYLKTNNFQAAALYFKNYAALNDSLHLSEIQREINEIENRFQNKQKADSILVLRKDNELKQLAIREKETENKYIISGSVLLLFLAILLYRNLSHRHRLLKQSDQLNEQHISKLQQEKQLIAAQSLIKGQEEERSRLAKDLHDGVGSLLSGLKLNLAAIQSIKENDEMICGLIHQLDTSINELRRVSHNMMPEGLRHFGLKETLENYCEDINWLGEITVRLQTYGLENRMSLTSEIAIYRIVQELLNNVIKHAKASQVLVQLTKEEDLFSLTVEDDGQGFDPSLVSKGSHSGISNIESRVSLLNGSVDFNTAPGQGTSVTVIGFCDAVYSHTKAAI